MRTVNVQVQAKAKATKAKKPAKSKFSSGTKKVSNASKPGWLGGETIDYGSSLNLWYGPDRRLWLPDGLLDRDDLAPWLDGSLAGDYGFDVLNLGSDQSKIAKYRENELLHARWAMLGAAGILIPEGLQANGADIKGGVWFETGAEMLDGGTLNYFAVPWGVINNPLPLFAVVAVEVGLMAAVEKFRSEGEGPAGYAPGVGKFDPSVFSGLDSIYPGGPFDPLNLAEDPEVFEELKVKEIKNGRLAMVSVLAYAVQAAVTGEGPYTNWQKHIADPFGYNLITILGPGEDYVPTL